jgi:type IV pilus assembly protein PilA
LLYQLSYTGEGKQYKRPYHSIANPRKLPYIVLVRIFQTRIFNYGEKFMKHQRGFTLIELLIVIAIVGILIAIAVPSYHVYTRRAHYTEVVQAAAPYKLGVDECYHITGALTNCDAGRHGVPAAIVSGQGSGMVDSVTVDKSGTITIVPKAEYGITADDTYVLSPISSNGSLVWTTGGGGVVKGYAN